MTTPKPNRRWYHPTPTRFILGLLAVQVFLFLSDHFQWFPFNERKGWTVLIAVGVVVGAVVVMFAWFLVGLLLWRRFRFGVRSLLVFVVVVSVPLGWFAWEMEKARQQREMVERIVELGGSVSYDYVWDNPFMTPEEPAPVWLRSMLGDDFFCKVVGAWPKVTGFGDHVASDLKTLADLERLDISDMQITDEGLEYLRGLTKLKSLDLGGTQITDEGLARLSSLANLEELDIRGTQITDDGLAHLRGMTNLRKLWLDDTQITGNGLEHLKEMAWLEQLGLSDTQVSDEDLAHLEKMTKLEQLTLARTQITDEGLAHLKEMVCLEELGLDDTYVTDNGLKHLTRMTTLISLCLENTQITDNGLVLLEGLTNLEFVYVDDTQVTAEGVKKLQKVLPNCEINH